MIHTLYICTTCKKRTIVNNEEVVTHPSAGEELYHAVDAAFKDWPHHHEFTLMPTECLSACKKACTFALTAKEKYGYVFGFIGEENVSDILALAKTYATHSDGILKKIHRPEALREKVLARIPPSTP